MPKYLTASEPHAVPKGVAGQDKRDEWLKQHKEVWDA